MQAQHGVQGGSSQAGGPVGCRGRRYRTMQVGSSVLMSEQSEQLQKRQWKEVKWMALNLREKSLREVLS